MKAQSFSPSEIVDLADSLRQEGRLADALETVERVLQKSPSHPRALLLQSRILCLAGRYAQALQVLGSLEHILGREEGIKKITETLEGLWQEPMPKMDPAFVTETMAELHIKQGYLWEAMEIYRQLYTISQGEERLWQKILDLRDRLEQEGSREMQEETASERLAGLSRWIKNQKRGV